MTRALGTAVLGAACALCAATFSIASLYVPGFGLLALGLGTAAWVSAAARGARVERGLAGATVEEGVPYPVRLALSTGALPAPGGELHEPLLAAPIPVGGHRRRRVTVHVRFQRRGRRHVPPSRLVIRDPLHLAARVVVGAADEVLVLPRIEPVLAGGADAAGLGQSGRGGGSAAMAELELDSLRPYRLGTPASRIHWPTVARTGTMMERRLVSDGDARPLVVLDPRDPADGEALDRAVRAAASLCVHLAREDGCALLLPGDRRAADIRPDLRAWPPLHARLATVAGGERVPSLSRLERSGAIFWVTGAAGGAMPSSLRRATAGARFLVTPGTRAGTAAFSVAGCQGYRLAGAGRRAAA